MTGKLKIHACGQERTAAAFQLTACVRLRPAPAVTKAARTAS